MYKIVTKCAVMIILILSASQLVMSQEPLSQDISFLKNQLGELPVETPYPIAKFETNEIKIGVQLFFLFYKNFLSSQDNRNCSFSPSCSTYCLHSIRKKGIVIGLMGAFDRLSRCNGLSPENYQIDFSTRQLLDPVE